MYDRDYYERGEETGVSLYTDYRWLPELTIPLAHELFVQLGIKKTDTVLDYGCAKGFLVKAFRLINVETFGVDISEYAISEAPDDIKDYVRLLEDELSPEMFGLKADFKWDWVIAKDVLEHIEKDELAKTFKKLSLLSKQMFFSVPLGSDGHYVIPSHDEDSSHIIAESRDWWMNFAEENGWYVKWSRYKMPHIKEAYHAWNKGTALICLMSKEER